MEKAWYIAVAGAPVGPHAREVIERLRAEGKISADTLVWRQGMLGWTSYMESGLGSPLPPAIPPSPPDQSNPEVVNSISSPTPAIVEPLQGATDGFDFVQGQTSAATELPPTQPIDDDGWQSTNPSPWRRYFARMFDIVIVGSLIWLLLATTFAALSTHLYETFFGYDGLANNKLISSMMTVALVAPIEALMLGLSGTTVGKWIFGVRVTETSGKAIGFARAGRREAEAFFRGLGLGIPLISLFTLIYAYGTLTKSGSTTWDRNEPWVVTYRQSGAAQTLLFIGGVVVLLIVFVSLNAISGTGGHV